MFNVNKWIKQRRRKRYHALQATFERCFERRLSDEELAHKKGGYCTGCEVSMPLGRYVWNAKGTAIEYYIHWIPHYRGDSHGIIHLDGRHEHLPTLPQIGEITEEKIALTKELKAKGLQ